MRCVISPAFAAALILVISSCAPLIAAPDVPPNVPGAIVDLATAEGVRLVKGQWRYCDAKVVEVDHRGPGPDKKASGKPNRTHDIVPHAGVLNFDDSKWEPLDPSTLDARRSTGRLAFNWYRINVTIPERVGEFDPTGSTVVFEIVMDDYAEVWVDGKLPQILGQSGGSLVAGWNAPNRLVVGRNVRPGQRIQLAIFAMNGPVSDPPANYIWVRSATLDFYRSNGWSTAKEVRLDVDKHDPALDEILPSNAKLERVADGFSFTEGPVWVPDGYLLFSDPNRNVIYRCTPDGQVYLFRTKSGYKGMDIGEYRQPGSNGLTLDSQGRLTICEHGNRRVTRLESNGDLTVLADRFEGKRLNSPNDLVYRSDGALYFTDPVFGLPSFDKDPRLESPYTGVYCLFKGMLKLVSTDLTGPNGLTFSPDEKFLYVCNWDDKKKVLMRYEANADGTLSNGKVFFDMTSASGEDALDGMKVDLRGNLYISGPGGLWILSPDGKHIGTLRGPEHPHNIAWGDDDGRTLYLASQTGLYRIRLKMQGIRPTGMVNQGHRMTGVVPTDGT